MSVPELDQARGCLEAGAYARADALIALAQAEAMGAIAEALGRLAAVGEALLPTIAELDAAAAEDRADRERRRR